MRERDHFIDSIRGFSILIVIITHALVPYFSHPFILTLWDRIHFAVPMLVFCSGYMQFDPTKMGSPLRVIAKRLSRLLVPYYVYAALFITTAAVFGRLQLTPRYLLQTISVTGGVDVSWFVLLFMCLGLLSPLLVYLLRKSAWMFHAVAVISLASSIYLIFKTPSPDYRWYMWIPWLFPYMFGHYYRRLRDTHRMLMIFGIPLLFVVAFIMRDLSGRPLSLISNKYPPTLYYLSYGLTALMLLSYIETSPLFTGDVMRRLWRFLSIYSYPLFFIHYFLLFILDILRIPRMLPSYMYVAGILSGTILIQLAANKLMSRQPKGVKS